MQNTICRSAGTWLVAVCFLSAVSARAVGPEVRDNAGLFSAPAVKQADETIRNIQKNFRKELLVETFASVPESRTNDYARNRLAERTVPTGPNQIWVNDLTYVRTDEGWLDASVVMDLWSRKIVGWATGPSLHAALSRRAL